MMFPENVAITSVVVVERNELPLPNANFVRELWTRNERVFLLLRSSDLVRGSTDKNGPTCRVVVRCRRRRHRSRSGRTCLSARCECVPVTGEFMRQVNPPCPLHGPRWSPSVYAYRRPSVTTTTTTWQNVKNLLFIGYPVGRWSHRAGRESLFISNLIHSSDYFTELNIFLDHIRNRAQAPSAWSF